ncbi:possible extracellular protein [Rhodococcus jostii RHA1]|uniref:Possible extracellular protein n=1 Tax=Rhodococcus jostii (strain RHA1) TaxID=101510 RepID=Q0SIX4_RHOJR|nr:hypothetical protein [Rhodococcus jostii]ABG92512.1 possible extracellular protein [Rhodococcus jostii RHA1]
MATLGLMMPGVTANADPTASGPATFSVLSGPLSILAPGPYVGGTVAPGETVTLVTTVPPSVTDLRGGTAGWTATAAITDFTQTLGSSVIPASGVTYTASAPTLRTGIATFTPGGPAVIDTAKPVMTAAGVTGNNTATWPASVAVAVPQDGVTAGVYTSVLAHSVA